MSDEPAIQPGENGKVRRGKALPWKQDPVILARMVEVERRYLRGEYNTHIAAALEVHESTVREDIKRLNQLWKDRAGEQVNDMRAARFAELENVKRMALASFDFDMEALAAVLYNEGPDGERLPGGTAAVQEEDGGPVKIVDLPGRNVYRDKDGKAQYKADKVAALATYRQAVMDQAKLYGLVIEKKDVTSGGQPMTFTIQIDRAGGDDSDGE